MTMDIFETENYRMNKLLLCCIGQWPRQSAKERYVFGTVTLLIAGSLFIPTFIHSVEVLGDVKASIDSFTELGIHVAYFVTYLNFIINAKKMKMLTDKIEKNWAVRTADFERIILENYAQRGRTIAIIYTTYIGSSVVIYLASPTIPLILDLIQPLNESRPRLLPFETEYFVDQNEKYFYILAHAWLACPVCVLVIMASDAMFIVYVHHACSIFAVLGAHLETLGKRKTTNKLTVIRGDCPKKRDDNYEDIVVCVKIHEEAVEFAQLLESWGFARNFFSVGISILVVTLTGFMAVTHLDEVGESLRYASYTGTELVNLFYLSWQGHLLVVRSEEVFVSAYNVDWYDMSPEAKKCIVMIMVRSLEPCKLTAGKIFVLSMPSFAAALKTSMSYFTVLLSLQ